MSTPTCKICGRPTTYDGEHQGVYLRGGRQAHIYCVQQRRGLNPDVIEVHTRRRMVAADELRQEWNGRQLVEPANDFERGLFGMVGSQQSAD